jgi:hypothetical protein
MGCRRYAWMILRFASARRQPYRYVKDIGPNVTVTKSDLAVIAVAHPEKCEIAFDQAINSARWSTLRAN